MNRDAEKPEKVREYTRKISSSSQHLLSLINGILDMSRIENGKTSLNVAEFSPPEQLLGDKLRLNQVLINLLSNAVKYTPEGGRITPAVEGLARNRANCAPLRFTAADNGFGMSEEPVKTIFDPFSREITDATRELQGTGLGMAITKDIADLMGGTTAVKSGLGRGSTFTVDLEPATANAERDGAFWPRSGTARMPAAEDNEINAEILVELLDIEGIRREIAPNGKEAADRLLRSWPGEFDMIFMDVQMPVMDGYEATCAIRSSGRPLAKTIPTVAMTANAFEEDVQRALSAGRHFGGSKTPARVFGISKNGGNE